MGLNKDATGRILSVIAYYDNGPEVLEFIKRSSSAAHSATVDFVVVVNKDTDKSSEQYLSKAKSHVSGMLFEIVPEENIGYLNALLFALQKVQIDEYAFIVLSNTDIDFCTSLFYDKLLETHYTDNIGCIAPSVVSRDRKTYSNPHYLNRIPLRNMKRAKMAFSRRVFAIPYFLLSKIKSLLVKSSKKESCYVYSPHGCFMVFTAEFARLLKGEIYPPIMYSEESFIGEILCLQNMKCYYDASIEVMHDESTVTSKLPGGKKAKYMRESLEYVITKYYLGENTDNKFLEVSKELRILEKRADCHVAN